MRYPISACLVLWLLAGPADAATMKISVGEPSGVERVAWPVTSGVPLPQGVLREAGAAALFAADGREVPLQTEALARWPDGSVRWLLLDFQVDLAAGQRKIFTLRCGENVRRTPIDKAVRVLRQREGVTVDVGAIRIAIGKDAFPSGEFVALDANGDGQFEAGEMVTGPGLPAVELIDAAGKRYSVGERGPPEEMVVEQSGPLRACVLLGGHHVSEEGRLFRYRLRIHAFRGRPFVRLCYTFINDHQDSLMVKLQALNLVLSNARTSETEDSCLLAGKTCPRPGRLLQIDESHYQLNGKRLDGRAPGWAARGSRKMGFALGVREFWQHWPQEVEIGLKQIRLGICPRLPEGLYAGRPLEEENKLYYQLRDGLHTFKVGAAKTHELWATFFAGGPDAERLSAFFQAAEDPLLATCEPAYVSSTKAAGEFPPADPSPQTYFGYDAWLDRALEAHLRRRDRVREYGMLNYGDWYGERKVNWGNLEYDLAHGLFLQYLRTGDRRYFLRAEQAARHHIDVDVVHATNPHLKNPWGPPPQVGEIWLHCLNHTGGYYQDAPLPVSRTYQMGHSTNFGHVWVSGDLDYYYLTGDRRAREVALQIADAMVGHMPTSYGTHIRALGWPMILVLHAYEATGEKQYLDAATRNWEVLKNNIDWEKGWVVRLAKGHCLHEDRRCHGNVPFMEGLTLCALARYHRITKDPEVLRAITVGIDQMIRECWQQDVKTFRYTACPLSSKAPYALFMLSVEAMAYEVALTGNREHLRVLREGFRAAIPKDDGCNFGKDLAQMIHFAPHGLAVLEE
jgi:hypothetical protein